MKNINNLDNKLQEQQFQSLKPCQQYYSGISNPSSPAPHINLKINEIISTNNSNIHDIDIFGYDQFESEQAQQQSITIFNPSVSQIILLKILIPSHYSYTFLANNLSPPISLPLHPSSTVILKPTETITISIQLAQTNLHQRPMIVNSSMILTHTHRDKISLLTAVLSAEQSKTLLSMHNDLENASLIIECKVTQANLWSQIERNQLQNQEINVNNFFMSHNSPQYNCLFVERVFQCKTIKNMIVPLKINSEENNPFSKELSPSLKGEQQQQLLQQESLKQSTNSTESRETNSSEDEDDDNDDNIFNQDIEGFEKQGLLAILKDELSVEPVEMLEENNILFLVYESSAKRNLATQLSSTFILFDNEIPSHPRSIFMAGIQPLKNYALMQLQKISIKQVNSLNAGTTSGINFTATSPTSTSASSSTQFKNLKLVQGAKSQDCCSNNSEESSESPSTPSPGRRHNQPNNINALTLISAERNNDLLPRGTLSSRSSVTSYKNQSTTSSNSSKHSFFQTIFENKSEEESAQFREQFRSKQVGKQPQQQQQQYIDFPSITSMEKKRQTAPQFRTGENTNEWETNQNNNNNRAHSETIPKDSSDLRCFASEEFRLNTQRDSRSQKQGSIHTGQSTIKHIMLSDDSSHFITVLDSGTITVWEIATKLSVQFNDCLNTHVNFIKSLNDNDRFFVGGNDQILRFYSIKQSALIHSTPVKRKALYCAAYLNDFNLIAVAGLNLSKLSSLGKETKRRNIKFYSSLTYQYVKKFNIPNTEDIITHMEYCQIFDPIVSPTLWKANSEDISNTNKDKNIDSIRSQESHEDQGEDEDDDDDDNSSCDVSNITKSDKKKNILNNSSAMTSSMNATNSSDRCNVLACVVEGSYGSRLLFISIQHKQSSSQKQANQSHLRIILNSEMLTINIYKVQRIIFSKALGKLICMPKPSEKKGQSVLSLYEIEIQSGNKIESTKHTPSFQRPLADVCLTIDTHTLLIVPQDKFFFLYDIKEKAIIDRSNALPALPRQVHVSPQNIAAIHLEATEGKVNIFKLPI